MKLASRWVGRLGACLLSAFIGAPLGAQTDALESGQSLYAAGRFREAADVFRGAYAAPATKAAAHPWLVASMYAAGEAVGFELLDLDVMHPDTRNLVLAVSALKEWGENDLSSARPNVDWFCRESLPGYAACQDISRRINAGEAAPPAAEWPRVARLLDGAPNAKSGSSTSIAAKPAAAKPVAARPAAAKPAAAKPAAAPRTAARNAASPNASNPRPAVAPGGAADAGGSATGAGLAALQPGDTVIVRGGGSHWTPNYEFIAHRPEKRQVEVRQYGSGDIVPCHSVARPGPADPSFFIGDWEVRVNGATSTFVKGGDLYRRFSGGMKLPPLRINADGTYSWVKSEKEVIRGRWTRRDDAPGIVLHKGLDGVDWQAYEKTEGYAPNASTRDEIGFHDPKTSSGYYSASRIGANRSCVLKDRTLRP